jgi:hypothetical protein
MIGPGGAGKTDQPPGEGSGGFFLSEAAMLYIVSTASMSLFIKDVGSAMSAEVVDSAYPQYTGKFLIPGDLIDGMESSVKTRDADEIRGFLDDNADRIERIK